MNNSAASILIVGHGSRDSDGEREFLDFARAYENKSGEEARGKIRCAFLELSRPSIPEALEQIAGEGGRKVRVLPYLLFSAGHVKSEIPEILREFSKSRPDVEIEYGGCLWPHPNLINLARERILQALESFPGPLKDQADVLIVGRGASDLEATSQFEAAVEQLKAHIPCRRYRHSYIALAEPKYADVLPEMMASGTRALVVFPFYLFTGILVKRIEAWAAEAQEKYPGSVVKVAPYFGSHPLMFEMLREKLGEYSVVA